MAWCWRSQAFTAVVQIQFLLRDLRSQKLCSKAKKKKNPKTNKQKEYSDFPAWISYSDSWTGKKSVLNLRQFMIDLTEEYLIYLLNEFSISLLMSLNTETVCFSKH